MDEPLPIETADNDDNSLCCDQDNYYNYNYTTTTTRLDLGDVQQRRWAGTTRVTEPRDAAHAALTANVPAAAAAAASFCGLMTSAAYRQPLT